MTQQVRQEGNVIPFTGVLQPQTAQPTPITNISAVNPAFFTIGVMLFAIGLSIGAISVRQTADYQQIEHLKSQSAELSKIKEVVCK